MPYISRFRAQKTLGDGRELQITWSDKLYPATQDEPEDHDITVISVWVDGELVDYADDETNTEFFDNVNSLIEGGGEALDNGGDYEQ